MIQICISQSSNIIVLKIKTKIICVHTIGNREHYLKKINTIPQVEE